MTIEWFDLGQRLHAAHTGRPVARLIHSPVPTLTDPIAVRATVSRGVTTVTAATTVDGPTQTAHGRDALALLDELGVSITRETHPALVTDDHTTLPALLALARSVPTDSPLSEAAAAVAWWADRADFPGGSAVVNVVDGCRRRFLTGTAPDEEGHASTWRQWLGVHDDATTGLVSTLALLTAGEPLPLLTTLAGDDAYSWERAQAEHADGWDWRRPDTTGRAATGLRGRCDAADLHAAAFLGDPLYRVRAVHTGHVVTGHVTPVPDARLLTVTCPRLDARLRAGNPVTGWSGHPQDTTSARFTSTVHSSEVLAGRLVLTLSWSAGSPPTSGPVTLHPAPPSPFSQRNGRARYRRLYGARRSWLTTGRTPVPHRRDVPLEVLVAGAEAKAD